MLAACSGSPPQCSTFYDVTTWSWVTRVDTATALRFLLACRQYLSFWRAQDSCINTIHQDSCRDMMLRVMPQKCWYEDNSYITPTMKQQWLSKAYSHVFKCSAGLTYHSRSTMRNPSHNVKLAWDMLWPLLPPSTLRSSGTFNRFAHRICAFTCTHVDSICECGPRVYM